MPVAVRFAPSPTGRLHVGNARTALINWLFARARGGRFILRLDDTDAERSDSALADAIEADLAWLGITWQELHRQSARLARYEAAFERLVGGARAYSCYETADELEQKRRAQLARGHPPAYDGAARRLSAAERRALEAQGRVPHWRFALQGHEIVWADLVQGPKRFRAGDLGDPVIRRADGRPTYIFASAVDDVELAITHVIRGEDHVTNAAVQIQIIEALGAPMPAFGHLPLLVDRDGKTLSKRIASLSLAALRAEGLEPVAIAAFLAALGTATAPRVAFALDELAQGFALERYGRAPARFDLLALERFNADILHALPFARARPALQALGLAAADERFWHAVRPNLERMRDATHWWAVCHAALAPVVEDPAYLAEAAALLPAGELDEAAYQRWIEAIRARTGRKGRDLYRPLRLALTAREHGPSLQHLLPIIGRERALARLRGTIA